MGVNKATRVLCLPADDDIKLHMERLSSAADAESDMIDHMRGKRLPRTRSLEEAIGDNLRVTALGGDAVNLPSHYARFAIEPIRFITENKLGFLPGNVIKYTMRYDAKDGVQDLRKARRCLDMMIANLEGDPDWWKRRNA